MKTISDMAGRTDKTVTWTGFVFFETSLLLASA